MPNLDGTGPNGQGPRTGRGMGNCGFWSRMFGRGYCGGCRYRQGCRRFISSTNGLSALENEEKILLEQLEIVKNEKEALKSAK
jgi:hypothetical protein